MSSLRQFSSAPCDPCGRDRLFIGFQCQECKWERPWKPYQEPKHNYSVRTSLSKEELRNRKNERRRARRSGQLEQAHK